MRVPFIPSQYEKKWRQNWENENTYSIDNPLKANWPKYYCLDMFPYPSGSGLHVGHWRGYVLSDVWSRYKTLQGYNVLHPMGWDNFGLPAENFAIKHKVHPNISTKENIGNMRRQLKEMGCIYDWKYEINTTHPDYYKWTQYIFLKMYERGLAYRKDMPVNWCPSCKAVLANEEVVDGECERCHSEVSRINRQQWMLKITEYADRLIDDLDELEWPEKVKEMQRNWIGRSFGADVDFKVTDINGEEKTLTVFTTRPDTLFGATFVVVAPEHPFIQSFITAENKEAAEQYIKAASKKQDRDRQTDKEKTGVFTGSYAVNPVNGKKVPIWISDYVLISYGTGAIMAVPAHDERDFEFAKKFDIPIIEVIKADESFHDENGQLTEAYVGDGVHVNSEYLDGLGVDDAKARVIEELQKMKAGNKVTRYKIRDWIFARQRYWGEPIPIVYCDDCGEVPVPYDQLPVRLPDVESYEPTDDASSPLSRIPEFVNTVCPKCGKPARRETDTMPQWAGSCWYFLRYPDKYNKESFASQENLNGWLPVDMYVGGIEHAVLHLLYSRFWNKVLYDEGLVPFKEPFKRLFNQGMITRYAYSYPKEKEWIYKKYLRNGDEIVIVDPEDDIRGDVLGYEYNVNSPEPRDDDRVLNTVAIETIEKMGKSTLNGVSPDKLVEKYSTDALRLFELFASDPALDFLWSSEGVASCNNFLRRCWRFVYDSIENDMPVESSSDAARAINKLIRDVTSRIELLKLNTAVSAFMEFLNAAVKMIGQFSKEDLEKFVILFSPFAPHFSEELWNNALGHENSNVCYQKYPELDESKLIEETQNYAIQIMGRKKLSRDYPTDATDEDIWAAVTGDADVAALLNGAEIVKIIVVKGNLVNIIIKK